MEFVPEGVLNRQIQAFQFKIQQSLNLYDEEIERMSVHLNKTKTMILEAQQHLRELDHQIVELDMFKTGNDRRRMAGVNTILARARLEHKQMIQNLQSQHRHDIENLQRGFEEEMDQISTRSTQKLKESTSSLDAELAKTQHKIDKFRKTSLRITQEDQAIQNASFQEIQNTEYEVIAELQYIVDQRNKERLNNLQSSRAKLLHCADLMNSLTHNHNIDIHERQRAIVSIDKKYQTDLEQFQKTRKQELTRLALTLSQAQNRSRKLEKAAQHLEQANKTQLTKTIRDFEILKRRASVDVPLLKETDLAQLENIKKQIHKQRQKVDAGENRLREIRDENESLRKEIWRIRHEIRFKDAPKIPNNL